MGGVRRDFRTLWLAAALVMLVICAVLQSYIDPDRRWFRPDPTAEATPKELAQIPKELFGGALLGFREVAAGLLWVRADDYFHSGRYDDIVPLFYIVVWLDPHQLDVYATGAWHLAYNLGDQRLIPEGVKFLLDGIRKNPNVWDLYFQLSFLHFQKTRDYDQAIYWAREAVKRPGTDGNPAPAYVKQMLAHYMEKNGQIAEMRRQWEENVAEATLWLYWPKVLERIQDPKLKAVLRRTNPVQINGRYLDLAVGSAEVAKLLTQPNNKAVVEKAVSEALVEGFGVALRNERVSRSEVEAILSDPGLLQPILRPKVWKKVPPLPSEQSAQLDWSNRSRNLNVTLLRINFIRKGAGQPGYVFDWEAQPPRWVYVGDGKVHQHDVQFDFTVKRVAPKKLIVRGKIYLPDFRRGERETYCRLRLRLRDRNYEQRYKAHENDWEWQRDNLTLRERPDLAFPSDPNGWGKPDFEYELDLSKDPEDMGHPPEKLFPFKAPEYEVTLTFDPTDQGEFQRDFLGYNGEGITDKRYLVIDKRGVRKVEKTIILRREDIL